MKIIVLFLIYFCSSASTSSKTDSDNSLFSKNFIDNLKTENDFKNFQRQILLQRNYQCLNRVHFNLDQLKNDHENFNVTNFDLHKTCLGFDSFKKVFKSESYQEARLNFTRVILNQIFNKGCDLCIEETYFENTNKGLKTWIYGVLASSVITLSSFGGAFLIPLTKHKYYKRILMFLISLAIGTLTGTGFLHLIPQAYGISEDVNYNYYHEYVWKSLTMIGGLYLFFIVEQILRFLIQFRKHRKSQANGIQQIKRLLDLEELEEKKHVYVYQAEDDSLSIRMSKTLGSISHEINRAHLNQSELSETIAPVAWIIIFGEGLHNLIDGLSIGAAFTDSILKGLSLSLAIICEEFPHKIGDFAILLASGMPLKVALFCNFLSSCLIFAGLFLGIYAGENLNANMWIYAVAGGMFIYIAVCDMIPELGQMSNEIEKEQVEWDMSKSGWKKSHKEKFAIKIKLINILIQNSGMLLGFSCMLFLALYAKKIQL